MMRLLLRTVLVVLALWGLIVIAGPFFDRVCLEGRFSAEQAAAVNSLPWGKCPSYRNGNCKIDEGDRMLSRECSEFSRRIFLQDWR